MTAGSAFVISSVLRRIFITYKAFFIVKLYSMAGVIATFVVMVTVVVKFATSTYIPGPIRNSPKSASDVFAAIPTIFFAYQVCFVLHLQPHNCMAEITQDCLCDVKRVKACFLYCSTNAEISCTCCNFPLYYTRIFVELLLLLISIQARKHINTRYSCLG